MIKKDLINKVLFDLGIRNTLPGMYIKKITIEDNKEKLVSVNEAFLVRETVSKKLIVIKKELEILGLDLELLSAYRSAEEQRKLWDEAYKITCEQYPNLSHAEQLRMTGLKVANPQNGFGGHQTGGAIDLTLKDINGNPLNMGTKYLEFNDKTPTFSKDINEEQQKNRKLLYDIMTKHDFVNYPKEWWHYSYGDQMWAAYSKKKKAIYNQK